MAKSRRPRGSGVLFEKSGAYYGRWRTRDGRRVNRRIGPVRPPGGSDGLTRSQAERQLRKLQEREEKRPSEGASTGRVTLAEAATDLRRRLTLEGARKSYRQNCESMQRVHLDPRLGPRRLQRITSRDVEDLASAMIDSGRSPKTVRNVLSSSTRCSSTRSSEGGPWTTRSAVRRGRNADGPVTPTPTCGSSPSLSSTLSWT